MGPFLVAITIIVAIVILGVTLLRYLAAKEEREWRQRLMDESEQQKWIERLEEEL